MRSTFIKTLQFYAASLLPLGCISLLLGLSACERTQKPNVTLTTLEGVSTRFEALKGRVILVNFWSTQCAACVEEMPVLAELHQQFQKHGYLTFAVAMGYDRPDHVRHFWKTRQLPFPAALDSDGQLANGFGGIHATPTTFLLDQQGRVVWRHLGKVNAAALSQRIRAALDRPA